MKQPQYIFRNHCQITFAGGNFFIQDLKSCYGTKIDEKDVPSSGMTLYDGAKIQLGATTTFEFNIVDLGNKEKDFSDQHQFVGPYEDFFRILSCLSLFYIFLAGLGEENIEH